MYIWGHNKPCGSSKHVLKPQIVDIVNVAGISCGNNFTLCWTTCGKAYSWGVNKHGVLGHGNANYEIEGKPREINGLYDHFVVQMSAGTSHCAAVTKDGSLHVWGNNRFGALGIGEKVDILKPKVICNFSDVKQVSCNIGDNHGHSLLITRDGKLFASGDGYKGKLGLGNFDSTSVFQLVQSEIVFTQVCSGGIHSAAISDTNHLFTWGCGSDGRLGHPEATGHRYLFHSSIPKCVEAFLKKQVIKVSASYYHTVALVK